MASPLLILTLLLTALSPANSAASPDSTNFIRRSCSVTLYPQRCYSSLKLYAATVRQNPLTLAVIAANISLANIKEASFQGVALQRRNTKRIASALHDCVDLLLTAADLTEQSAAEIQKLGPAAQAGGPSFAWEVSNAQTWMSAALTNEDTCIDGIDEVVGGGGATAEVAAFRAKVARVEQYTSNALALLNALVGG
ncbi:pectinesterase inhibitor 9-like [Phalaenopsis equestris]|uniref:pectinesterase inhibitor 9-like n=1 Tax=Phalaenopsis equestris TaxID=78828 RepID=UPI0009E4D2EB|nr:pectinesterase inhibitor 9-like [Phalaenopsis equestris]